MGFPLFGRKHTKPALQGYDGEPAIRCSICTGEQVAGFRNRETGKFTEAALLRTPSDLEAFREKYGITGEIPKFY